VTQVSFVGLGSMGQEMVHRLLSEHFEVTVWNRSPAAADELVAAGARRAESVADCWAAGPVLSMLSNDAAVDAVFSAEVLQAAPDGAVHVNMATTSLASARAMAARHADAGVGYLAAPVLGRPPVARNGALNILAAGDPAAAAQVRPVLAALGRRIWDFGAEPARANLVKIAMNYALVHAIQALAETIPLAQAHGVDGRTLVELMGESFFPGPVYSGYGREIADADYLPAAFSTTLGLKDVTVARDAGAEVGLALPGVPALTALFTAALEQGLGEHDWAAIAEVVRGSVGGSATG
jgi:3-hydroxyisobutyrate dehydrogenase-like beta-hydroxyacid dehydrogenase